MPYELISGVQQAQAYPDTFWIPSDEEKAEVQPGDYAKLIFYGGDGPAERMWVQVTAKDEGRWRGVLANVPYELADPHYGDEIEFLPEHIIRILESGAVTEEESLSERSDHCAGSLAGRGVDAKQGWQTPSRSREVADPLQSASGNSPCLYPSAPADSAACVASGAIYGPFDDCRTGLSNGTPALSAPACTWRSKSPASEGVWVGPVGKSPQWAIFQRGYWLVGCASVIVIEPIAGRTGRMSNAAERVPSCRLS